MRSVAIALAVLAAGCGTSNYTPTSYFAVDPPIAVDVAPTLDASLGLRPMSAPRTYSKGIVAREANLEVVYLPRVAWMDRPENMLTRALTDAIADTRRFQDVGNAADMFVPGYVLTGELRRFDILRHDAPWSVLCEARLELRKGQEREPVWQETLRAERPVEGSNVPAAARAMSDALGALASEAARRIVEATAEGM